MVFDSRRVHPKEPDVKPLRNRFSQTEVEVTFRRLLCYRCQHTAVYKYKVKKLRRNAEILTAEDEHVRQDHVEMWQSIPRFTEIAETVRCKNCREVLGICTECIY